MRRFLVILLVFSVMTAVLASRDRVERPAAFESIVHVFNNGSSCSGFIVAEDTAVTAKHCVQNIGPHDHAVLSTGWLVDFKVAAQGRTLDGQDWAIINLPTQGLSPLAIETKKASHRDFVFIVGHPEASLTQFATPGLVNGYVEGYLEIFLKAYPGDSGSPVFNADGKVIGILVRAHSTAPYAMATPIQNLEKELKARGIIQ
jgi:V8-like Glu-specific endopeptidase